MGQSLSNSPNVQSACIKGNVPPAISSPAAIRQRSSAASMMFIQLACLLKSWSSTTSRADRRVFCWQRIDGTALCSLVRVCPSVRACVCVCVPVCACACVCVHVFIVFAYMCACYCSYPCSLSAQKMVFWYTGICMQSSAAHFAMIADVLCQ